MAETTVHTKTVLVDGDGTTYYAVDGKLESITIPAGPVAAEIDRLRERVAALEAALDYIRDLARTGLPPAGYSGENWAQHKLNRIAAKSDRALASEGGE